MVRPILMVYYNQSHPYELLLQSLPISAEALGSYPALQQQTAATMVVAGYELEARLMGDTRMILPLLYSREPENAACYLKENPDLGDIMCKGLASRMYNLEKLVLKEAVDLVKKPRAGVVTTPILEDLSKEAPAAKRAKQAPAKPQAPADPTLGQE